MIARGNHRQRLSLNNGQKTSDVDDAVQETESDNKHEKYAEERYGKR